MKGDLAEVMFIAGGSRAYQYYRAIQPFNHCKAMGGVSLGMTAAKTLQLPELKNSSAEVLILHNCPCRHTAEAAAEFPGRLVWDLDDNFFETIPENPAHRFIKPDLPYLANILERADLIWTTTERLKADTGWPEKTRVVPTLMDFSHIPDRLGGWARTWKARGKDCVWWGGSSHSLDLDLVASLPEQMPERRFAFFGMLPEGLTEWSKQRGVIRPDMKPKGSNVGLIDPVGFHHFWPALRGLPDSFGVGLCPLVGDVFNAGKSPLKFLEMASIGLGVVASNHPPYSDVIKHGETGFLVGPGEWREAIEAMTPEIARRGYEFVRDTYSWQAAGSVWVDAIQEAASKTWPRAVKVHWGNHR